MSGSPGWYPDPGGQPERFRYWNGTTWSVDTTDDPSQTPPSAGMGAAAASRPRAARWLILITVLSVLVAAGSIALQLRDRALEPPVLFPTPSAGREDRASRPDTSPGPDRSPQPRAIGCPDGAPDARAPHPADNRVYGGNLSFPRVDTFVPERAENRLSFAYDVTQQIRTVSLEPPWIAQLALGRLVADGYPRDARHTAELVTECIVASDLYRTHGPTRRDLESRPITVSGIDGWLITTDVVVDVEDLPIPGDRVAVVVVPDGADWGVFFGAVPIGDATLTETLTRTVLSLRAN
jgi:Protein of unknown function (DUF2510)